MARYIVALMPLMWIVPKVREAKTREAALLYLLDVARKAKRVLPFMCFPTHSASSVGRWCKPVAAGREVVFVVVVAITEIVLFS